MPTERVADAGEFEMGERWGAVWAGSACAIVVCATVVLGGCERRAANERAAPESAFRSFRDALASRDRDAVWAFLGDETRAALTARAEAMQPPPARPVDLLQVVWVPDETDLEAVRRTDEDAEGVTLVFSSVYGEESSVRLLRSEVGWRVELRLPDEPE
jgi:hypothetical protein